MLTATQACKMLGISRDTLRKLITEGEFPGAIKLTPGPTGHWRIPDHAVTGYMERNAYQPEPKAAQS